MPIFHENSPGGPSDADRGSGGDAPSATRSAEHMLPLLKSEHRRDTALLALLLQEVRVGDLLRPI